MSLEVKNIVKKYGDKTVVNNLSFKMNEPGVYALLGTNGAGKTTTIRIILGMLSKDEGEVLWNGEVLDALNTNIGYLAEERGLYPKYSLLDQLLYFAKLKEVPKEEAKKRIKYWAERLEVEEYIYPNQKSGKNTKSKNAKSKNVKSKSMNADQLSKGNQQKIQLMAALISDPDIIILDEPLSGLDPVNTDLFKTIIREEIAKNKYLIMSSHQMSTIEEFCTDITILNRGNVVLQGNLNAIKKSYGRVNMYVRCEEDIESYISQFDFAEVNRNAEEYEIKVKEEAQAREFLNTLVKNNVTIIKYELSEPSLHEIFVEKVGNANEE